MSTKKVRLRRKRRIKLIQPRFQLKLIGSFLGISALALLLQFLVLGKHLSELALSMPDGGVYLNSVKTRMLMETLAFSFGVLLPLTICVGVLVTFRIAGPLHAFEQYFKRIANGEQVGHMSLRKNDQLQDLCENVNAAMDALEEQKRAAVEAARHGREPLRDAS